MKCARVLAALAKRGMEMMAQVRVPNVHRANTRPRQEMIVVLVLQDMCNRAMAKRNVMRALRAMHNPVLGRPPVIFAGLGDMTLIMEGLYLAQLALQALCNLVTVKRTVIVVCLVSTTQQLGGARAVLYALEVDGKRITARLSAQHAQLESTQNQQDGLIVVMYVRQVNTIRIPDQTNQKIVIIVQQDATPYMGLRGAHM